MEERAQSRISIIVPVYNTEAYLPACIESLQHQTHGALELIFVDDGSTDRSAAILDAYAKADPRIRVIRQKNSGVSAARNAGIDAATGEFIGFVDSDDRVEPRYCEALLDAFYQYPEIGVSVCNRFIHGHPNGRTTGGTAYANRVLSPEEALRAAASIGKSFEGYLWNKLFRASLFLKMQDSKPRFRLDPTVAICEDLLLCAELFASGQRAYYTDEPLYHYTYRESGALRTFDEKRMSEFSARARIEAIAAAFDAQALHLLELSHVKSALNMLYAAKVQKNKPLEKDMCRRIDARLPSLLRLTDLPKGERAKLLIRRAMPVLSMRAFLRAGA